MDPGGLASYNSTYQFNINHFRMYLRSIFVRDLRSVHSSSLSVNFLKKIPCQSRYTWPDVPKPLEKEWSLWEQYVTLTISPLIHELGAWNLVPFHLNSTYYISKTFLFTQIENCVRFYKQVQATRIYKFHHVLNTPQLSILQPFLPCNTSRLTPQLLLVKTRPEGIPNVPTIIQNCLPDTYPLLQRQLQRYRHRFVIPSYMFLSTDGSYKDTINHSAFIIADCNGNAIISGQGFPNSFYMTRSSYDSELYAVFLGVQILLWIQQQVTFSSITIIIDNQAVVHQISDILSTGFSEVNIKEYDRYYRIQSMLETLSVTTKVRWQPSHTNDLGLFPF